jgi:SNF2 family DNA or RNA helicase
MLKEREKQYKCAILGDDMGFGKTGKLQCVCVCVCFPKCSCVLFTAQILKLCLDTVDDGTTLIIVPANLITSWKTEMNKFLQNFKVCESFKS